MAFTPAGPRRSARIDPAPFFDAMPIARNGSHARSSSTHSADPQEQVGCDGKRTA